MQTITYNNHAIKTTEGKFITCKKETEAILEMIYAGKDETIMSGNHVSILSDRIETEGKDRKRVTTIEVKDEPM